MPRAFGCCRPDGTTALAGEGGKVGSHFFAQSSFATHMIANARGAVPVAKDIPLELVAPMACGLITGAGAVVEELRVRSGQSIAVFGAGSVGMAAIMAAKIAGAGTIVAVDIVPARLDLALELGATHAINGAEQDAVEAIREIAPQGMDFTFNTTVSVAVFTQAVKVLGNCGVAGFVTRPRGDWVPDMMDMLAHGKKMVGILGGSANPRLFIPQMVEWWQQGRFPVEKLVTTYDFADFGKAWHDCEAATVVKPVLVMGD
jgi:aryl-alcohol dehydrogenase